MRKFGEDQFFDNYSQWLGLRCPHFPGLVGITLCGIK